MAAAVQAAPASEADEGMSRHVKPGVDGPTARQYKLDVIQQPRQARMCGAGDKADRRPIDPPPLLRLRVKKARPSQQQRQSNYRTKTSTTTLGKRTRASQVAGSVSSGNSSLSSASSSMSRPDSTEPTGDARAPAARPHQQQRDGSSNDDDDDEYMSPKATHNLFCFASLVGEFDDTELYLLGKSRSRYVTGSVVSSLFQLKDQSCFVFPDLSIRTEGRWRFKMSLYEIQEDGVKFCTSVFTDTFQVYSSKRFPGMGKSTELSKSMAQQGLRLRIRRPGANREDDDVDDDEQGQEEQADVREAGPRKRAHDNDATVDRAASATLTGARERTMSQGSPTSAFYQPQYGSTGSPIVSPEPRYSDAPPPPRAQTHPQPHFGYQSYHGNVHGRPQTSPSYGSPYNYPAPAFNDSARPQQQQPSLPSRYVSGAVAPAAPTAAAAMPDYSPRSNSRPLESPRAYDRARVEYFYGAASSGVPQPYPHAHVQAQAAAPPLTTTATRAAHGHPSSTVSSPPPPPPHPALGRDLSRTPEQDAAEVLAEIHRAGSSSRKSSDGHNSVTLNAEHDGDSGAAAAAARKNSGGRGSLADLLGDSKPADQDVFFFD
ncbi:hypothetical protein ACM66B_001325 [Microbotryomycetes sp. NB124-2]